MKYTKHLPIITSVILFIAGVAIWFFKAFHLAGSLVWMPETPHWQRISICLKDTYYIPIFFTVVSVINYILLRMYFKSKS